MSDKALALLLWVKVLFLQKKKADISKTKRALLLKGTFSETKGPTQIGVK